MAEDPKEPQSPADAGRAAPPEAVRSTLDDYRAKRTAGTTPEPMASTQVLGKGPRMFVVHQHDATRMHWDLRLEIDGILCSWAVPKAPSMDPDDKRLAVKVENHPLEYVHFEAVIPKGNYGAGPMIAWDRGLFRPLGDPAQGLLDGEIKFELYGYKLRGAFTLVHTGKGTRGRNSGLTPRGFSSPSNCSMSRFMAFSKSNPAFLPKPSDSAWPRSLAAGR